jgi:hypothetical protein
MLTTSKVKVGESQLHYDQGIGAPLISIDITMLKMDKLCLDVLRKYGKWRTNIIEAISMPTRAHEKTKERAGKVQKRDQDI